MGIKEKIKGIFKSSNEEKLVKKLLEIKSDQLQLMKDISTYARFERMRQTWGKPNPNENGSNKIYYKILKIGEYVTEQDIKQIMDDPKCSEVLSTKEFKKYINYLKQLKRSEISQDDISKYKKNFDEFVTVGNIFLKDFKVYKSFFEFVLKNKWAITEQEAESIGENVERVILIFNDLNKSVSGIKEILNSNMKKFGAADKYKLLELANEVQDWLYGKNNFYQKGAQKVVSKYKDVFDLIMKCNKNKLEERVRQLDSDVKLEICDIYGKLQGILPDAYGEGSKECKKSIELQLCFS